MKDDKPINGNGLLVWYADGKLKHIFHSDQELFLKEKERLQKIVPPNCLIAMVINWDDGEVLKYSDKILEELKS